MDLRSGAVLDTPVNLCHCSLDSKPEFPSERKTRRVGWCWRGGGGRGRGSGRSDIEKAFEKLRARVESSSVLEQERPEAYTIGIVPSFAELHRELPVAVGRFLSISTVFPTA